ncbi:MAG: substrate-binding domain-containing protein [Bacteroidales bacterium]|nr:substrate-binding domain-containing protein [Bacteroidales bacterium]
MKRTVVLLLVILLPCLCMFNGCSQKKVKIGLLMDNYEQDRWERDRDYFIQKAEELGAEVLVEVADGDAARQLEQAQKLLDEKADVLVIVPVDLNEAAKIIPLAHRYQNRVLSYDRLIKDCNLDFYISFDNVEVGALQAEYLTKICPVGNYAIIGGAKTDNNSFLLKIGQMNVLEPLIEKGDIGIVYDQFVDRWHEDNGYAHMKECLKKNPDIDAVLVANDGLATGVARALEEHGLLGKVHISGQDAELSACQRIIAGTQTMTVYKPIEAIAYKAAGIAVRLAEGDNFRDLHMSVNNGKKMVPALLLPSMVVNRETIKLTVVADGYLKENKIFE